MWKNILVVVIFVLVVNCIYNYYQFEGFSERSNEFIVKKGTDVYDEFYVDVYDSLVYCREKNAFEIDAIIKMASLRNNSNILDIGSGTGHHVAAFRQAGYKASGIDVSTAMVKKAKNDYPEYQFQVGDALDSFAAQHASYTHITCLYFTIYYMKDKRLFFRNCYEWLKPGGFLILHLVNRDKFDPILPAGDPFTIISTQRYAKERITSTVVKFKGYDYKSNFEYDPKHSNAYMIEEFKNTNTGAIRKNEHQLYMPTQKVILGYAKDAGFKLKGQTDMMKCQYETQYLYFLTKP